MKFNKIFEVISHFAAVGIITYFFFNIAKFLYQLRPVVGIDLYLSVNFATYLAQNFSLPFSGWYYPWYGGAPLGLLYPALYFYLALPLVHIFGAVKGVQILTLSFIGLYVVMGYFLFWQLSKNKTLAILLSLAVAYSFNLYHGWIWMGTQPYISTMFSLPLSLFLALRWLESGNLKYLLIAGLILGIVAHIHPQTIFAYSIPYTLVLIILAKTDKISFFSRKKITSIVLFIGVVYLIGLPVIFRLGGLTFSTVITFIKIILGGGATVTQLEATRTTSLLATQATFWNKFQEAWTRSNIFLVEAMIFLVFIAIIGLLLEFVLDRKRVACTFSLIFSFCFIGAYYVFFISAFWFGFNPFVGGWPRAFWSAPLIMAAIASIFWRPIGETFELFWLNLTERIKPLIFFKYVTILAVSLTLIYVGRIEIKKGINNAWFNQINPIKGSADFKSRIQASYQESSSYPSLLTFQIDKEIRLQDSGKLVPEWLNPNDMNYRIAELDATITIWWNSLFKMPQSRGYLDAPGGANYSGWQYLTNIALWKDELVKRFKFPSEIAKNNAQFMIDWQAIRYLEGKVGGPEAMGRDYGAEPSNYVVENFVKQEQDIKLQRNAGIVRRVGMDGLYPSGTEGLRYFEIKDQYVSPIYMATSVPAVLVISNESGQDVILRLFADLGIGPQKAILVNGGENADNFSAEELSHFQFIIMYQYNYHSYSSTWKKLKKYVEDGGKLFIDTGSEVKESKSSRLPDIFPMETSIRGSLGPQWQINFVPSTMTSGIDFKEFSPAAIDNAEWNFSYPTSDLSRDAVPILTNYGKAVLVKKSLGQGKIIWSGINLPYHIIRNNNWTELDFFHRIIDNLADFKKQAAFQSQFERPSPREAVIFGKGQNAVLFKEADYPVWKAKVFSKGKSKSLRIFEAGPSQPGYMYVIIPKEFQSDFKVTFNYLGTPSLMITYAISLITFIVLVDLLLFGRRIIAVGRILGRPIARRVSEWWSREDSE